MTAVSVGGRVFCAEPPAGATPSRSCSAVDLFTVSEGVQCGNCLAVNGRAYDVVISERRAAAERLECCGVIFKRGDDGMYTSQEGGAL